MRLLPAAVLAACLLIAAPAPAASGNALLEQKLKSAELPFEVDKDGDFKVLVNWQQEKRSQLVFLSAKLDEYGGVQFYTAFAPAFMSKDGASLDSERLRKLMELNSTYKFGAWALSGKSVFYVAKLPATVDPAQLRKLLLAVAEQADNLELELTPGKDDL